MSLNLRIRSDAESLTNAVRNVNGKIIIRIKRNLFSGMALLFLNLITKTRNKSSETEKKNTLCTTSISYARTEYVTGDRNVNPNNTFSPIFVFFFTIRSKFRLSKYRIYTPLLPLLTF